MQMMKEFKRNAAAFRKASKDQQDIWNKEFAQILLDLRANPTLDKLGIYYEEAYQFLRNKSDGYSSSLHFVIIFSEMSRIFQK